MSHTKPSSTKSQGSKTLFIAPIQLSLSLSEILGQTNVFVGVEDV